MPISEKKKKKTLFFSIEQQITKVTDSASTKEQLFCALYKTKPQLFRLQTKMEELE